MSSPQFVPGSVDETVYLSLRNFPTLFSNRTQVLHYIFMGIGTGYGWSNGRLVDIFEAVHADRDEADVIHEVPDNMKPTGDRSDFMEDFKAQQLADWNAENERLLFIHRNAAKLVHETGPIEKVRRAYDSAPYFHVPADVQPDWLAAREEIGAVVELSWYNGDFIERPPSLNPVKPELSEEAIAAIRDIWNSI